MEIIAHQGLDECFCKTFAGVYLPHLHNIVGDILSKTMVPKRHCFLVQITTGIIHIQHHTRGVHKYRCGFGYLDTHLYKVVPEHNRLLDSLLQCCELGSKF